MNALDGACGSTIRRRAGGSMASDAARSERLSDCCTGRRRRPLRWDVPELLAESSEIGLECEGFSGKTFPSEWCTSLSPSEAS